MIDRPIWQRPRVAARSLLDELRTRRIGEFATLGPQQMLLILPSGAHGVFVPRVPPRTTPSVAGAAQPACTPAAARVNDPSLEPTCATSAAAAAAATNAAFPPFDLSVIRACELYLWGLHGTYERQLMGLEDEWCTFIAPTAEEQAEEAAQLRRFTLRQERVIGEMRISREEWLHLAMQMQKLWDAEEPSRADATQPLSAGAAGAQEDVDALVDGDDSL